jgi:hypothetical protein
MRKARGNRWFVFGTLFGFMLLHQADMLLIGPLTTPIMETFHINEAQMGAVVTGALIVGGVFYPVWGYLYDRYSRPKLLALASFLWGSTTWLSALAPTFPIFVDRYRRCQLPGHLLIARRLLCSCRTWARLRCAADNGAVWLHHRDGSGDGIQGRHRMARSVLRDRIAGDRRQRDHSSRRARCCPREVGA